MRSGCQALLYGEIENRAEVLDREQPNCACAQCSFSPHGPPANDEILVRLVVSPRHVKKGKVARAALSHAETIGMSTFREAFATDEEIFSAAERLVRRARESDPAAGVFGVLRLPATIVRGNCELGSGGQVYCLYDTALDDAPAHADVFQRVHEQGETERMLRRGWLFDLVKDSFLPVTDFRAGLLTSLSSNAS